KMVNSNTTNDLELVLDRIPIEYPALVMETFLSSKSEIRDDCASLADGYCWMVSKHSIFVWSATAENDSGRSAVQLQLPPSGLPYSARSVVVYKNTRGRPPGLLVVSGEGVARHWPSVTSSLHSETVIDLASEVTLSVQLLESSQIETSFVLTTTSGSVYLLSGGTVRTRGIQWVKIGSRETRGIGRRLSNIIFGSQGSSTDSSQVLNSLIFQGESQDDGSLPDALVVTISPSCMNCFSVDKKSLLWTVNIRTFLEGYITGFFERSSRGRLVAGVSVWLLDAAKFRGGMLLLLAGSHDNTLNVSFFLATTHFDDGAPVDVDWFSVIPVGRGHADDFKADEESDFVGRVLLCVPGLTANSSSCEKTDGVIILYPHFVQSVYPPDHLGRHNELPLNKVLSFPIGAKIVGHACDERFCYVMTVEGGTSCVRLLPKGFDDDLRDDKTFIDDLRDIKENVSQDEKALPLFISAFASFVEKNIVSACEVMKHLLSKTDADLTALVYAFLKTMIDQPIASSPEVELKRKKIVCNRVVLFLKHMDVYDRVATTKVLISDQRNSRTGASILDEMAERVAVAIALRSWETAREDRAEILEQITKRLAHITNNQGDYDNLLYSTLSSIHLLPTACAETMRELMKRAVDKTAKRIMVHLCSDMMLTFADAIEMYRRTSSKQAGSRSDAQWTTGAISDAYSAVCKILLKEMESLDLAQSEKARLRDYVVRMAIFHLSECNEPIDGHEIIIALYNVDECDVAVELAEKFKDFKVLVKVCLDLDDAERRTKLDAYKKRFAADEFDMYLCRYLKQKNLHELLLDEKGDRVDQYLSSCEGIRWRRELQNRQFEKASRSLLSLADRENSDVKRQRSLYAFAKLAAACNDATAEDVVKEANRKLVLIKHQSLIPESLIKTVFPDNPNRPLTALEIIELNMLDTEIVEGHRRALYLVARLLQDEDSAELRTQVKKIWSSVVNSSEWKKVTNLFEVAETPFGGVLKVIADEVDPTESLLQVLPPTDALLRECKKALSVNESAPKWIRDAGERVSSLLRANLKAKRDEKERRERVMLSVFETNPIFKSRPQQDEAMDCLTAH
uniref:Nucleoporin_C domain-containing protein n=1 Tax=Haemonchus contortus TaxID=6289 RepID=A0A7I4YRB8_HAECO